MGVEAGDNSIVGPVHFVRPATTSASNAKEANLAFGWAYYISLVPLSYSGSYASLQILWEKIESGKGGGE